MVSRGQVLAGVSQLRLLGLRPFDQPGWLFIRWMSSLPSSVWLHCHPLPPTAHSLAKLYNSDHGMPSSPHTECLPSWKVKPESEIQIPSTEQHAAITVIQRGGRVGEQYQILKYSLQNQIKQTRVCNLFYRKTCNAKSVIHIESRISGEAKPESAISST